MLEIKNLSKRYGDTEVLHNVNIRFDKGIYGLLGPNGAGKTTLMSIIVNLLKPTSGDVLYDGVSVSDRKCKFISKLGFLPQYPGYYKNYTATEFLEYVSVLKGIKGANKQQITELLNFVNLYESRDKKIGTFSGGMLRRVGLAQTLLGNPEVIILDEPTAGLDPIERIRLRNLLSEIANDRTVIVATHIVPDVEYIANYIIMLFKGNVAANASPDVLISEIAGKVWSVKADIREAEAYIKRFKVSNIFSEKSIYDLRIISDNKPLESAEEVFPTLEDVFLYYSFMRGEK